MTDDDEHGEFDRPSKSQRKRDMQALKDLAARLTDLPADVLRRVEPAELRDAIAVAARIHRGSARKRQIQYIAKLLSRIDPGPVVELIDGLDASKAVHVRKFHQLERWRERLLDDDPQVMDEIIAEHPDLDRPQLRNLVRQAAAEKARGEQGPQFRKLFQFLKQQQAG